MVKSKVIDRVMAYISSMGLLPREKVGRDSLGDRDPKLSACQSTSSASLVTYVTWKIYSYILLRHCAKILLTLACLENVG